MKAHSRLKVFISAVFVLYVVIGLLARLVLGPPGEIFPVFTWALFSRVPDETHEYALRILAVDQEKVEPNLYFQEAGQWFDEVHSLGAYLSIQKLGTMLAAGATEQALALRRHLESDYLGNRYRVRYEIVKQSFDPIERWRFGTLKSVRPLGVFESVGNEK